MSAFEDDHRGVRIIENPIIFPDVVDIGVVGWVQLPFFVIEKGFMRPVR